MTNSKPKEIKFSQSVFNLLLCSAFLISVAMTPWWNSDSLIIPKLIILVTSASFLLIPATYIFRLINSNRLLKFLLSILILILIQLILVVLNSDAPLAQQIFGRTGRGLGFLAQISLIIFLITTIIQISQANLKMVLTFLIIASLVSSIYSLMQRFNLDIFDWSTRTNGIIGTLGNPNFQSSFAAISIVPAFLYFGHKRIHKLFTILLLLPFVLVIYITQSTQGYVATLISILTLSIIYFWFKSKIIFKFAVAIAGVSFFLIIQGILNKGILAPLLYKRSIQSRGEMLRNTFSVAKDNPIFGVGLDSLGDKYLIYKDQSTVFGVNEFTDHAHNSIVNNAAIGGFFLAALHFSLILLTLYAATKLILISNKFDRTLTALICGWVCYLAQSMISPETITLLVWNSIFTGSIIGLLIKKENINLVDQKLFSNYTLILKPLSILLFLISVLFTYPYFNVDKLQQDSSKKGDANLAIVSATSFPESTIRYSRIGQSLIDANLLPQALEVARSAVKFNPNAPSAWGLILVNGLATKEERINALAQLKLLDPTNKELNKIFIP